MTANTFAEPGREKQPAPSYEGKATVLTTWRTRRRTRRRTRAGRKLIRHIKWVRLTTASYKVSAHHNKPGVNTRNLISLTGNEPEKSLFNVNSFVKTSSSDFKVIVRPRLTHARGLVRSINFHNLHVIDSLHDDQKVEVP